MIQVECKGGDPLKAKLDVLYILAVEGEELDDRFVELSPTVRMAVAEGDFNGKSGQLAVLYLPDSKGARRLALVGVGRRKKLNREQLRKATGKIVEHMRSVKAKQVGLVVAALKLDEGEAQTVAIIGEAAMLAAYRFNRLKTTASEKGGHRALPAERGRTKPQEEDVGSQDLTIYSDEGKAKPQLDAARIIADASNRCRAIADEPANIATPSYMADCAVQLGKEFGFKVEVLEEEDMKRLEMGAFLCVGQGSPERAKFIIMEHRPKKAGKAAKKLETVCLVGKGLTFDAGGISIKPADRMWEMKYDKCGGCAVITAMAAIAQLDLPFHVYGLVGATENMPDGAAVKPGDIVRSITGHTIEVLNTDAEGRLVLADVLGYCHRLEPDILIDYATLTGACVVALAAVRAGLMAQDEGLTKDLIEAGDRTGEKLWPLPLDEEYGDQIKGEHADLKNIGGRWGGAITAGYFLSHFMPPKSRWAHIDIAGPAWKADGSGGKEYLQKGASGFGVRLTLDFLRKRAGLI